MIKGIYYAARSLNNGFRRMSNIANNLANINTTGYKREIPFEEMMISAGNSQMVQFTDFRQGSLTKTSSPLDFAISGSGFFVVETPSSTYLTRNGNFTVSDDGFIVNDNGNKLMGIKGPINLNDFLFDENKELRVLRNGEIYVGEQLVDNLLIMQSDDPLSLRRYSNMNFLSITGDFIPVDEDSYQIMQGYLEDSNVNPIVEMEEMIKTNIDYQSSYKMINFLDKSLEKANEIGRV
ncbi:MAG: flagellar hook-basal body protein [Bacteroidetes bacterium]|nr:flagellar hook-basal body protein [Bacteroidota bacterium]MCH8033269.1 flagellar hook-basal body protein [Bacteroidota bacterium]